MAQILLLNGPNLNMLGQRETHLYGEQALSAIEATLAGMATEAGHDLDCLQSNSESTLLQRIHQAAADGTDFILFNPAAFTHTSVSLRDGLLAASIPFIELHLSNPASREPFRQKSYFSDIAVGVVAGFGADSYQMALGAAMRFLADGDRQKG